MGAHERLGLDLTALVLVAVLANPVVTGIASHTWIGVIAIVPLLVHMVLNWSWTVTAVDRFLGKIRPTMRTNVVIDFGLFLSMVTVSISGAMVTPGFAVWIGLSASPLWHAVHLASSNMSIIFLVAHIALHLRWMVSTASRRPRGRSFVRLPASAATAATLPTPAYGVRVQSPHHVPDEKGV
jgi:hypothetical protein